MFMARKWGLLAAGLLAAIFFSVSAQAQTDLSGLWTGRSSGNQVTIEMRPGGFAIIVAGQRRAGQYGDGQFFREASPGLYLFTKPDGNKVKVQVLATDSIRVTNPDGWTDTFTRPPRAVQRSSPVSAAPRAVSSPQKLPPARPAKMAAWSTKAMSSAEGADRLLHTGPQFAAERADALASCSAATQQFALLYPGWTAARANLYFENAALDDERMTMDAAAIRRLVTNVEAHIATGRKDPVATAFPAMRCLYQRRLAQLEGSPLAPGAVAGTLTPLSIGGQAPPWKQQGKDARIIASNGKSAMDCVKLVEVSKADSRLSGLGGRVLVNNCSGPVEIGWCYTPGDCDTETGSSWTVAAGRSWPVSAEKPIRWAACHGANTTAFVKFSHGLRYYCSAPAAKPKR